MYCLLITKSLYFPAPTGAKKTFYIDQHLQSHWMFPDFEMLKWARFFGYFKPGESLRRTKDEWGIISDRVSPGWEQIIDDKNQAVSLIQSSLDDQVTTQVEQVFFLIIHSLQMP